MRVYTDAAEMLKSETPDFVDVATTAQSHRQLVCLALAHGAAAICQKPFAETLADARAMVVAAQDAGRPLMVHENFRWQRPFRILKQRIAAGDIGDPYYAHISFRHGYDNYRNQPYLAELERFSIMDVGLHLFDLARWLMGEVESLHCRTQRYNPRVRGEDAFFASLRHEANRVSVLDCSFQTIFEPEPFPETVARIEGEGGTLELDARISTEVASPRLRGGHRRRAAGAVLGRETLALHSGQRCRDAIPLARCAGRQERSPAVRRR